MPDPLFSDKALMAAKYALDGLSFRQELIGQNLANVDTPGYKSQTVTFEQALKRALNHDQAVALNTTHVRHMPIGKQVAAYQVKERTGGSSRADGNNVDIDVEMVNMSENTLKFDAMSTFVNRKYRLFKDISTIR